MTPSTESQPETVEVLASAVVNRVLSVYREEYIEKCALEESDSLLGLVKRLESALAQAKK